MTMTKKARLITMGGLFSLLMPFALPCARGADLVVFDRIVEHTGTNWLYQNWDFVLGQPMRPGIPKNWLAPVNYAEGTYHARIEVMDVPPADKRPVYLGLGWRNFPDDPTIQHRVAWFLVDGPGVFEVTRPMASMWSGSGKGNVQKPWDWSHAFADDNVMTILRTLPSQGDPKPIKARVTLTLVPKGATFVATAIGPVPTETPRPQKGPARRLSGLDVWERHVIDPNRDGRAVFITAADLDGDGHLDIVTGPYWYKNPGAAGGAWQRREIGAPFGNMATVYDFDGDKDLDVLGTVWNGKGKADNTLVWARNDGHGRFTVLTNIAKAEGDFLQGVGVGRFGTQSSGPLEVALSWHNGTGKGVQMLTVPEDPSRGRWSWRRLTTVDQEEAITVRDIDRDEDMDLLLGTKWLRNDLGSWTERTLSALVPDRSRLADINRDRRLDAVVGEKHISAPGKVVWLEQPKVLTEPWTEHVVDTVVGPLSVDVADMDGDGDTDVIVGEHDLKTPARARLLVFENADGHGGHWTQHVVHTGDEHHDGSYPIDIDGDGDLDILSIGWGHNQVLLYENRSVSRPIAASEGQGR